MSPLCGSLPGWVGLRSARVPGAHAAGLDYVAAPRLIAGLGCTHLPGAHAAGLDYVAAPRLITGLGWFAISMRARGSRRRARLCRRSAAHYRAGLVCDQHACPGFTPPGYMIPPLCGSLPGWVGLRSACVPGVHAAGLDYVAAPRLITGLGWFAFSTRARGSRPRAI
jgi:hypothetical protein